MLTHKATGVFKLHLLPLNVQRHCPWLRTKDKLTGTNHDWNVSSTTNSGGQNLKPRFSALCLDLGTFFSTGNLAMQGRQTSSKPLPSGYQAQCKDTEGVPLGIIADTRCLLDHSGKAEQSPYSL